MKSPLPLSLPLPLLHIALTAALTAAFLTTSCERRGGVPLTTVAEDARVIGLRRDFLADSGRWQAPRAEEIATLTKLDRDLKAKWRGLSFPDSKDATAIALSRELTEVRQKLDRACADRSLLTAQAKLLWDEREASGWSGGAVAEKDTGYRDPYAFYAALPRNAERDFIAQRARIADPLWTALDTAARRRLANPRGASSADVPEWNEKVRLAAERLAAADEETARLREEWDAKNWEGYVTGSGAAAAPTPSAAGKN